MIHFHFWYLHPSPLFAPVSNPISETIYVNPLIITIKRNKIVSLLFILFYFLFIFICKEAVATLLGYYFTVYNGLKETWDSPQSNTEAPHFQGQPLIEYGLLDYIFVQTTKYGLVKTTTQNFCMALIVVYIHYLIYISLEHIHICSVYGSMYWVVCNNHCALYIGIF